MKNDVQDIYERSIFCQRSNIRYIENIRNLLISIKIISYAIDIMLIFNYNRKNDVSVELNTINIIKLTIRYTVDVK